MRSPSLKKLLATLSVLTAAAPARAAEPPAPGRALFVPSGFDAPGSEDIALLRAALARSTALELTTIDDAVRELERAATSSSADPSREAAELLVSAREAFVELRLAQALDRFTRALERKLASSDAPVEPKEVARILFERALVHLAARKEALARADLIAAVGLDPELDADPDQLGPPVVRALAAAKRRHDSAPRAVLRVDRAPEDAVVRVNGTILEARDTASLRGAGPHLVTAERPGWASRSELVVLGGKSEHRHAIVLTRASGALLASQALEALENAGARGPAALLAARCLSIPFVLEASRDRAGEIELALRDSSSGEIARSARGRRLDREPWPYAALAESLERRRLEAPVEPSLAPAAPKQVELSKGAVMVEPPEPWFLRWYVWTAVGVALGAGVVAAVLAGRDPLPPEQVLVVHGP